MVKDSSSGAYRTLTPLDAQSEDKDSSLTDGLNTDGVPYYYDKTGTSITLDMVPVTTITNGLKLYINREGSYFTTASTTQSPGWAGLYHEWCVLVPAYRYARANGLKNQETLKRDMLEMKENIIKYYSRRSRDEREIMTGKKILYI